MVEDFDPASHFTPEEYARISQPKLERAAARARAAAKRAAARGDDESVLLDLRARADEATFAAQENRDHLAELQGARADARVEETRR